MRVYTSMMNVIEKKPLWHRHMRLMRTWIKWTRADGHIRFENGNLPTERKKTKKKLENQNRGSHGDKMR